MQDRMIWIGTEGGRDCYALQTYRLCCKWFAPRNRRDDSDVHARAFAASSTCASLPVAPHVPVAHTFARKQVQGNQGQWLEVDYILIDFVGPSMMSWLMTVNHRWTGALFSFVATSFRLMYSILMYVNIEYINLNDVATKRSCFVVFYIFLLQQ